MGDTSIFPIFVLTPCIVVGDTGVSETVIGCHGAGNVAERQLESVRTRQVICSPHTRVRECMVHCNTIEHTGRTRSNVSFRLYTYLYIRFGVFTARKMMWNIGLLPSNSCVNRPQCNSRC
jgi:hypothetical protein